MNSIDLGSNSNYGSMASIMATALETPLTTNHYEYLLASLQKSRSLLYLGDNAGEIVFDCILIEEITITRELEVNLVVREVPIINDATMTDALAAGINRVARVVSSESGAPATILSRCSSEMQDLYRTADVIITKGQGNYESLNEEPGNIFFLLKVKCSLVSKLMGLNIGGAVLKSSRVRVGQRG